MRERLVRLYWLMVAPAILLFAVLYAVDKLGLADPGPWTSAHPGIGTGVFITAALLGVAAPLGLRTAFVSSHRDQGSIPEGEVERFQRRVLLVALCSPYLAVVAAYLELPTVLFAGTVLSAFYALYYLYPTRRRIAHERRIFRTD